MTIEEFIHELSKLDPDKEVSVAFEESDGLPFTIENGDYCVFLVAGEE